MNLKSTEIEKKRPRKTALCVEATNEYNLLQSKKKSIIISMSVF